MQGQVRFVARCARCSNGSFTLPKRLVLEADMSCKICGHQGKLIEFADLPTLDAILRLEGEWREVLR